VKGKVVRTTIVSILVSLFVMSAILYFVLRVPANQIVVERMIEFHKVMSNSERVIKDKEAVKQFTYAVRFADKQPGMADMPQPPYQFTIGDKQYYLWISDEFGQGTLMKLPNTGTTYGIDESRTSKLWDILTKEYDMSNFLIEAIQAEGIPITSIESTEGGELADVAPLIYRLGNINNEWLRVYNFGSVEKRELAYEQYQGYQILLSSRAPIIFQPNEYIILYYSSSNSTAQTPKLAETKYGEQIQRAIYSLE